MNNHNNNGLCLDCKASAASSPLHPLGFLPPEIWEKVFTHLENDPESLFTCYKTCVSWNRILEPVKLQFLFKLVAPILKQNYLDTSEFVKCRQISKAWRFGVEKTFENLPYLSKDPSVHFGIVPYIWYSNTVGVKFNLNTNVQSFVGDVFSTPKVSKNPFFHKTVKCINTALNNEQKTNRLFKDFTTLACEHGHSIESCVYLTYGGKPESHRQIEKLFVNFPNLKSLAILTHPPGLRMENGESDEDLSGFSWLIRKKDLLPPLPNFVSFNVYLAYATYIAEIVLLSYGTQLESFHCDFRVIQSCSYLHGPVPEHGLKNMRDLDVFDAFGCSVIMERLLLFEMPYLQRLALDYTEVGPRQQSFQSVLKIIDKFSESLKEIRLPHKLLNWTSESSPTEENHCKFTFAAFEKSSIVSLPFVKQLGVNLEILECPVLTWFIKKFPNLEILHLTNFGVLYGYESQIRNQLNNKLTPFWKLVPGLREIVVERAYLGSLRFFRKVNS